MGGAWQSRPGGHAGVRPGGGGGAQPGMVSKLGMLKMGRKPPTSQAYAPWESPPKSQTQSLAQFLEELTKDHGQKFCTKLTPKQERIPVERCSRCTKEEMWAVYDVFRSMDRGRKHKISRQDFFHPDNHKSPTLIELRTLRKARLDERFRNSAEDITLEEFLSLVFPGCSQRDLRTMKRWARLKDAQEVLRDPKFRGEAPELRRIFDLLDENGDESLSLDELERAGILTKSEIAILLRGGNNRESMRFNCNFQEFLTVVQTHLKETYVSSETRRAMEEEKHNDFQLAFRNAFAE